VDLGPETIVASAVATDEPFGADTSGETDASRAIQRAIDAVAEQNGGVVFLPAGRYRIESGLELKQGVALIGEWRHPHHEEYFEGTLLLAHAGRGDPDGTPLIEGQRWTTMKNISVWYPEQSPDSIVPYPPTVGGNIQTIKNVTFYNAYVAIAFDRFNSGELANVYGTALSMGVFTPLATAFSWVRNVEFSNRYWAMGAKAIEGQKLSETNKKSVEQYTRRYMVGFKFERIDVAAVHGIAAPDAAVPVLLQTGSDTKRNYGFGVTAADIPPRDHRKEVDWAPWYFRFRYGNVDNVPETPNKTYTPITPPSPGERDAGAVVAPTQDPYGAAGDGETDDTKAIQRALADIGDGGGGTVYLPQGQYRITDQLTVPEGVELRGAAGTVLPRTGNVDRQGQTVLQLDTEPAANDPDTDPAPIHIGDSAGIRGITLLHPDQRVPTEDGVETKADLRSYPFTIRVDGSGSWVQDILLVNSYNGIDVNGDESTIRSLWVSAYNEGIRVGKGAENVSLAKIAVSWGPAWQYYWLNGSEQDVSVRESHEKMYTFMDNNPVTAYRIGDCSGLTTWGIAGFYVDTYLHLMEGAGGGPTNATFWLNMSDVPQTVSLQADAGSTIDFIGYFATGQTEATNFVEIGDGDPTGLEIYGRNVMDQFHNHPFSFTEETLELYNERSLVSDQPITTGWLEDEQRTTTPETTPPERAIDRDDRTAWVGEPGQFLEVDLGEQTTITGFGVKSAGWFGPLEDNITRAELWVSTDGDGVHRRRERRSDSGRAASDREVLHGAVGSEFQQVGTLPFPVTRTSSVPASKDSAPTPRQEARYVQLRLPDPDVDRVKITDWEVYGHKPGVFPTVDSGDHR